MTATANVVCLKNHDFVMATPREKKKKNAVRTGITHTELFIINVIFIVVDNYGNSFVLLHSIKFLNC